MATKTMTAVGNAQIDTAQSKYGGASGLFDGTGDAVTTPDSAEWAFGVGKFSIDCWFRLNATGSHVIVGQRTDASNFWEIVAKTTGSDNITFGSLQTAGWDVNFNCTATLTTGVWYHLAIVRNGTLSTDWFCFLDGVALTKTLAVGAYNATLLDQTGVLSVGSLSGSFGNDMNGWIDELRISKGIARWTSNFTPPAAQFGYNSNNNLALHFNGADASTTFTDDSANTADGSSVKTVDGLTRTAVKTINGLASASIKKINGLTDKAVDV